MAAPEFHGIPWNIAWNSMEYLCHLKWRPPNSMESLETRSGDSMEFHGIPWNLVLASSSMELSKFHGIPWNFPFDMEKLHGIPWNCEISISINFIIGEVYFTVCCIISCYYISDNPLVVEILRYVISKATFWCPHFAQMAIFHSKWRPV